MLRHVTRGCLQLLPSVAPSIPRGIFCRGVGTAANQERVSLDIQKAIDKKVEAVKGKTGAYFDRYADKIRQALEEKAKLGKLNEDDEEKKKKSATTKKLNDDNKKDKSPEKSAAARTSTTKAEPSSVGAVNGAESLDSIMKVSMLQSESKETIVDLWKKFHADKDFIFAGADFPTYKKLKDHLITCPRFLFALPKDGGIEFQYMESQGNQIMFTQLAEYQLHKENARPFLSVTHYTDLADSNNLVLMRGEVDTKRCSVVEAQTLYNQLQIFYMSTETNHRKIVHDFNHKPDEFDYNKVVDLMERL